MSFTLFCGVNVSAGDALCDIDDRYKWLVIASLADAEELQSREVQISSKLFIENNKGSLKTKVSAFGYTGSGRAFLQHGDKLCAKKIPLRERRDVVGLK